LREELGQQSGAAFQTGIGVDLDQVRLELGVEHEVVAEQLVTVDPFVLVQQVEGGSD
tara:strand:- start:3577 stop:3747 length:171 start_codon:yes stop_codon:yes gene_type:complete